MLPTRKKIRLPAFDYSSPNVYFITLCTANRQNLLWESGMASSKVPLSCCGVWAEQAIQSIPAHYPSVHVEYYVVMPNHIHLLLRLEKAPEGAESPSISNVIRQMKGWVSKQAGFSLWQKGFYDHVIRSEADYREIWEYIEHNPDGWIKDSLFVP